MVSVRSYRNFTLCLMGPVSAGCGMDRGSPGLSPSATAVTSQVT